MELGIGHLHPSNQSRWMKNRKRPHVEARNAMFNALHPFVSRADCASLFAKDHATVIHAIKNHDMYLAYSAHYGRCYELATRIVREVTEEMDVFPVGRYNHIISSVDDLESLERTVENIQKTLSDVKRRIKENQSPMRKYRTVSDREE